MNEVFLTVFNMGISASFIIPVVLILRFLLKNAPKWVSVCLWAIVGIRLICPFSIESIFSLIPSAETVSPQIMVDKTPQINTGIPIINSTINPIIENSVSDVGAGNENILQKIIPILSVIWIAGVFLMIVYMAVSYIRIKNKVRDAVLYRNNIFQSENVSSPFVLGIIKPKIYLPFNISDENAHYVISHEIAHIKRKDHLWKPLGYFLLSFHWYNPLMWIAYIMLSKDIELACDEKVVKDFSTDEKADYSEALLNLSISRKTIAACPLAFGEVNVKNRVKSVLTYKKPAFWIIIVAIVSVIAVGVCFLTNPENNNENNNGFNASFAGSDLDGVVLEYETSLFDSENFYISLKWVNNSNHKICFGNDFKIYKGDTEYLPMVENYFNAILNLLESGKTIEQKQDLTSYAFENGVTYTLVKEFYIEGKSDKKYKVYVDFSFNVNYSFTNKHYVAENIFYESEGYKLEFGDPCISSVVYIDNPSPEFKISGNSLTLYEYADYSPEWTEFGNLKRIYLNEFNFDSLFQNNCKKSDLTPEVIRKNNKMAFYVVDDFSIHYLTIQNNDDIYIFENFPNNSYFRWGYKLKTYSENPSLDGSAIDYESEQNMSENCDENDTSYISDSNGASDNTNTSSDGASDDTDTNSDDYSIESLRKKYPEYFSLDTMKGLEVYVWQMAHDLYSCVLLPGKNSLYSYGDILQYKSVSMEIMASIVASYELPRESVTIIPISMPHSSYYYPIDDEYIENTEALFWSFCN